MTSTTHAAVSEDSGEVWTSPGAWPVMEGVWRVPLPLPMDGLRAVNVYVVETLNGLTLIDGGWAIEASRQQLAEALRSLGRSIADIAAFLVTHVHRDHYTQAVALRREVGARITLGRPEKLSLDRLRAGAAVAGNDPKLALLDEAGATELAQHWETLRKSSGTDPRYWEVPDVWLSHDQHVDLGARRLEAIHTPGHTRGHFVFRDKAAGLLFAGDHVLPTITPSIGFETEPAPQPLGDFMASLTKVRALPDSRLLPAHGPVVSSTHHRIDELLAHHESRLEQCLSCLDHTGSSALAVAELLSWTGRGRRFADLDVTNRVLATLETRAHLELLTSQGRAVRRRDDTVALYWLPTP
jgi:glyoxylase-like metal-dependent hydrolase (beta-lactamase superfamily II)